MTVKKILSAIVLGAFVFGVPVANFDLPLTKSATVYAAHKSYENAKKEYEQARKRYREALREGDKAVIKKMRFKYDQAKKEYERARERRYGD